MNRDQLKEVILGFDKNLVITENSQYLTAEVSPEKLHDFCHRLKFSPSTGFDYVFSLIGMDYGDTFGVIYYLESTKHHHQLVVKAKCADREKPVLDTVCDIWRTAEFLEREVFDLFGVHFSNHPDMRRIFMDDDWVGHPLQKNYSDNHIIVR